MGYVPTHGPNCRKVKSYSTECKHCGDFLIYFECTCGSKVFFEPKGGVHSCGGSGSRIEGREHSDFKKQDIQKIIGEIIRRSREVIASGYGSMSDEGKWRNRYGAQKSYHKIDCKYAKRIQRGGKCRRFKSAEDAEKAGYKPCGTCSVSSHPDYLP